MNSILTETADQLQAINQFLSRPRPVSEACGCMGPQGGDPLCPCAMRWTENVNGKTYKIVEERDPGRGVWHHAEEVEKKSAEAVDTGP